MWGSYSKIGGGATGTIRPSTSPRMPTSGFEVRGIHNPERPRMSIQGCSVFEGRGPYAGLWCPVHGRPPALLSRLLSKRLDAHLHLDECRMAHGSRMRARPLVESGCGDRFPWSSRSKLVGQVLGTYATATRNRRQLEIRGRESVMREVIPGATPLLATRF